MVPAEAVVDVGPAWIDPARTEVKRQRYIWGAVLGTAGVTGLSYAIPTFVRREGESRRSGAALIALPLGVGWTVGAIGQLVAVVRLRDESGVKEALRSSRWRDRKWYYAVVGTVGASILAGGLIAYGVADEPMTQGAGLGLAAGGALVVAVSLPLSRHLNGRLRPYRELFERSASP